MFTDLSYQKTDIDYESCLLGLENPTLCIAGGIFLFLAQRDNGAATNQVFFPSGYHFH